MGFDVQGARQAGYSDAEIAGYLATERQFDADGARRAGYTDQQIIGHLVESQQRSGSWLGRRARDAIEGIGGAVATAAEAVTNPMGGVTRRVQQALVPNAPSSNPAEVPRMAADALGLGAPQTPDERFNSAVYQGVFGTLPTLGLGLAAAPGTAARTMLGNNALSQLAAGGVGGGAAEATRQAGGGELAQLGAGLLGGAGTAAVGAAMRGAGRVAQGIGSPFTQAGREGIATDIMLRASADPQNLQARIGAGMAADRLPGSRPTTGTVARDNGLVALEQGMRSRTDASGTVGPRSPAVALRDSEAVTNAAREAELMGMAGNTTPEVRGQTVRQALGSADEGFRARTDQLFNIARDRNTGMYSIDPVLDAPRVRQTLAPFAPENMGGGVPAELQDVLGRLAGARERGITLDQAQNLRSELGDIAGRARMNNDRRVAAAAGALQDALENRIQDPNWMRAVAARREQGMAMGRNEGGAAAVGNIMRRDQFGMPMVSDPDVMRQALSSPLAARQTLEAGYQALDAARRARMPTEQLVQLSEQVRGMRTAMREQFVQNALDAARTTGQMADSAGNMTAALSPAQFQRFMRQNAQMLPELFEPGQMRNLTRLVNDFADTSYAQTAASARGSPTVQNLSVGNLIARASNGLLDPGMPGLQNLMGMLRPVFAASENATQAILTQAMTDPRFAQVLLARATPAAMQRAANYIESNVTQRAVAAAGTAAVRQGIRTAGEQAQLQQQQ